MPSEQGGYFTQLQTEIDAAKKAETELCDRDQPARGARPSSCTAMSRSRAGRQLAADGGRAEPRAAARHAVSRIQETQAKLDELLLKYTDKHPDVIAARATLGELKQRRAAELESLRRGDASAVASSGAGNNPGLPKHPARAQQGGRRNRRVAARSWRSIEDTVADLRKRLNSAPQVEAEYQQLNRDYDVNKAEYTALLESYQKARLGEQADNAGSVRFEVVQPPDRGRGAGVAEAHAVARRHLAGARWARCGGSRTACIC